MMRLVAFLLFALLAGPAAATHSAVPGLYSVTGVASDDVLNVREAPNASSPIVGQLAPNARDVEVVDLANDGTWGRVNVDGQSGWVNLSFLRPMPGEWHGQFPSPATCFGTEPFWSVNISQRETIVDRAGEPTLSFSAGNRTAAQGRRDRWSLRAFRDDRSLTVIIGTEQCSDGMSDRRFGMTGDVILSTGDGHTHLSGCCSLSR